MGSFSLKCSSTANSFGSRGTLTNLDLTKVVEMEDMTDLAGEAACASGACEVR